MFGNFVIGCGVVVVPGTLTFLVLPLAAGVLGTGLALAPLAFAIFAAQSAQQRVSVVAPTLAAALLALSTSAIHLGQAAGGSSGGWLIANRGHGALSEAGLAWLIVAIGLSLWAPRAVGRRTSRSVA